MPDKITTLKLIDNTDVFPNIKDENIPNTIMRIADLSKYVNQLKSINITGDIVSTTTTSDIATFTNVHVDGNLFVNGVDNIVDKNGNKIINTGTFDPTSDNPAGQKSIMDAIIETDLNARFSRVSSGNLAGAFSNLTNIYSGKFHYLRGSGFFWGNGCSFELAFSNSDVLEIDHSDSLNSVFENIGSIKMGSCFTNCYFLQKISATYSLRNVTSLFWAFRYCHNLRTIKLKDYPVSFDISSSINFQESDLVEILNNLMDLTGKASQTLTMGATNLAKLTDTEKAIATNKNWVLA